MKTISKTLLSIGAVVGLAALGGAAAVYSGAYNVAADDPHTRPVHALLEAARSRSIATRAGRLQPPGDLDDPARIRQGAGNYDAMCVGCHLAPGMQETELSRGLYPAPPNLARRAVPAAEAFWAVKHGIKATGMPAWGKSMDDEYIWNMAAFLQELPELDSGQYRALVASSDGHSHGGGETGGHSHAPGEADDHHDDGDGHGEMEGMPMDGNKPHSHAPGTPPHDDNAPAARKTVQPAEQTHDHADMPMPEPTEPDHADDGHQH